MGGCDLQEHCQEYKLALSDDDKTPAELDTFTKKVTDTQAALAPALLQELHRRCHQQRRAWQL